MGPRPPTCQKTHCRTRYAGRVGGQFSPSFPRSQDGADSKIVSPLSESTMAGILLLGLIAMNSGVNWSPLLMLIGMTR